MPQKYKKYFDWTIKRIILLEFCEKVWVFVMDFTIVGSRSFLLCLCCCISRSALHLNSVPLGSDEVDPRGTVHRTRGVRLNSTEESYDEKEECHSNLLPKNEPFPSKKVLVKEHF